MRTCHDGVLHLVGNAIDDRILRLDLARKLAHAKLSLRALGKIRQRVFRHHHFADQVHQPVDFDLIDLEASGTVKGIFGSATEFRAIVLRRLERVAWPLRWRSVP